MIIKVSGYTGKVRRVTCNQPDQIR